MSFITGEKIDQYKKFLIDEEKAAATISKYIYDVEALRTWLGDREIEVNNIFS